MSVADLAKQTQEGFATIDKKIDLLETLMMDQFNKVYKKIDKVETKVDDLGDRLDSHEHDDRVFNQALTADIDKIKSTTGYLDEATDRHNIRITRLEIKAGVVEESPAYATAEA